MTAPPPVDPVGAERRVRLLLADISPSSAAVLGVPVSALRGLLAALDAARTELAEIREAFDAPPYETHASMLALLREAVRLEDENAILTVQHRGRGELITRVAEAADHEAQYPGQGLAEHVADLRAEVERLSAQRDAALEIHQIYHAAPPAAPYCQECPSDLGWPCETARALGVTE